MPEVKNAYFLPFHVDHTNNFQGIIDYETKSLTLEDRIRYLDVQCGVVLVKRGLYSQRKPEDIQ